MVEGFLWQRNPSWAKAKDKRATGFVFIAYSITNRISLKEPRKIPNLSLDTVKIPRRETGIGDYRISAGCEGRRGYMVHECSLALSLSCRCGCRCDAAGAPPHHVDHF